MATLLSNSDSRVIGQAAGPAAALAMAALVFMSGAIWIVASPLRRMKVLPGEG
jgi:hypothetical protein